MAKGTGLGLSLVKHIIETVHHGRLFVESTQGKGSTFGFELDLAE
jgi:signal transduction histidine kinase